MIYLQISSGRGPVECQLAIKKIVDRMLGHCLLNGNGMKIVRNDTTSAIIGFDGSSARSYVDSWIGTILWVCEDPITKNRKRKNWFVGIKEIELPSISSITIKDEDLVWEAMRASGKGGQNVNKISSKIRLTHTPSGISIVSEDERSQKRNKSIALERLHAALARQQQDAIKVLEAANWAQHNQIERGNPVKIFEGLDFVERR